MRWKDLVREEVSRLVHLQGYETFTRQDVIDLSMERFRAAFPGAKTLHQTLSRELQELRDRGEIEFVAPGQYRLLIEARPNQPEGSTPLDLVGIDYSPPEGPAFTVVESQRRRFQDWLRARVIPNFQDACAVCGLSPEWFLDAAHLRPVRTHVEIARDPTASVALCKNHHAAMDSGAIVITKDLTIDVNEGKIGPIRDLSRKEVARSVLAFDGQPLRTPANLQLNPAALPSIPLHMRRVDERGEA